MYAPGMREIKRLRLRYADTCECGVELAKGELAGWDRVAGQVFCVNCLEPVMEPIVEPTAGIPGASLVREYERRHGSRERRVRAKFPKIGGFLLAIAPEPHTTKAFAIGAKGEQKAALQLGQRCPDVLFLHNRRLGAGEHFGDIDHIAVAPSGVFIIDAKNYRDAKVRVSRPGLFSSGTEKLMIRGRNRTKLVESLKKQKASVEMALDYRVNDLPIPVTAMFCFLDVDLPWFAKLSIQGFLIRGGRGTAKVLNAPGPLTAGRRQEIWTHLAMSLPSA